MPKITRIFTPLAVGAVTVTLAAAAHAQTRYPTQTTNQLPGVVNQAGQTLGQTGNTVGTLGNTVGNTVGQVGNTVGQVGNTANGLVGGLQPTLQPVGQGVGNALTNLTQPDTVNSLLQFLSSVIPNHIEAHVNLDALRVDKLTVDVRGVDLRNLRVDLLVANSRGGGAQPLMQSGTAGAMSSPTGNGTTGSGSANGGPANYSFNYGVNSQPGSGTQSSGYPFTPLNPNTPVPSNGQNATGGTR